MKCKYCGLNTHIKSDICYKCRDKLPFVKKLIKIFQEIKEYCEEDETDDIHT